MDKIPELKRESYQTKLIIIAPNGKREIHLGKYNPIGRHAKNRIQIDHGSVSKEHCLIFLNRTHDWVITDLHSTNGTFVNRKQIQGELTLHDGDEVGLGSIRCTFINEADSASKMFEMSEEYVEPLIHTTVDPMARKRFLPEKEISDTNLLRTDYEKLRITYELQRDIGLDTDIQTILELILERTFEFQKCDRGLILLANRRGNLEPKAFKSRNKDDKLIISSTLIRHVKEERTGIISSDIMTDDRFKNADSIVLQGIRSSIAAPILHGDDLLGIIIIDSSEEANVFAEKDLALVTSIVNQTAHLIKNSLLHEELKLLFDSSIRTLSAMVDARHSLTAGHSQRVTEYSMMIAGEMGLSKQEMEVLEISALLHDIGKIGIKDYVLLKDGTFNTEERDLMNTHPEKTKMILNNFRFPSSLKDIPEIAACHHEKVNGQGYPYGLTGDQIPVISKIIVVADVFDALTSVRDYPKYISGNSLNRDPMPLPQVISILKDESGSHFDSDVVFAFFKCLPRVLLHFRGGHFSPEYVDEMIRSMDTDVPPTE